MLSPRIHSLDQFRALNRATTRHDWRMPEVGLVFSVTNHTYQTTAILPVCVKAGRLNAMIVIQDIGTGREFMETLRGFWAGLDSGVFGSPRYSNLFVSWAPLWVQKAVKRQKTKAAKRRSQIRRFLVREGLVVAS